MDKDELWAQALPLLLDNVDPDDPKSVFLHLLTPFGLFGDQFILLAENAQVESWVNRNYLDDIRRAVSSVNGNALNIGISSRTSIDAQQSTRAPEPHMAQTASSAPVPHQAFSATQAPETRGSANAAEQAGSEQPDWVNSYVRSSDLPAAAAQVVQEPARGSSADTSEEKALFSKCTFDTFVVGKSNEFARGAALAVAEQPGVAYNPLFIYGSSGLGKTHLLVAITNYVQQNFPLLATRYVSASTFLSDFIDATLSNTWDSFNMKYHQADVLLVDDVQYLEGKDETINQLFIIFNEMTDRNKQIVLSADRAPKDIDMDERMRSRFVQGLLADIKPPDYETRLAIIKNFLSRMESERAFFSVIPEDVLAYLAQASTSNIREVEGALTRLIGHMTLGKRSSITVEETKEILQDFFPDTANKQVTIASIQNEVERFFQVSHEDMISSKRSKAIAYPRHIAIYLSRYMTEESLESIGKKFGNRDHTTVMHSVSKIEEDQKDNRLLFDQIEQLTISIKERC